MNVDLRQGSREVSPVAASPGLRSAPVSRWMRRVLPVRFPEPAPPDVEAPRRRPEDAWWRRVLTAIFSYRTSFVVFVLAPSFACAVYLAFIAADQYMAEARFAVRAAQFESTDSKTGSIQLSSSGLPVLAGQDAYVVASYIRSQAIFADLPDSLDLRAIYSRRGGRFLGAPRSQGKPGEIERLLARHGEHLCRRAFGRCDRQSARVPAGGRRGAGQGGGFGERGSGQPTVGAGAARRDEPRRGGGPSRRGPGSGGA